MEYGLWDRTYLTVIALMPDDADPYNVISTGTLEQADSLTEWIEVVSDYPDDYIPDYPELLGFSTLSLGEDERIHRQFPTADFSAESLRKIMLDKIDHEREFALAPTNQFVIDNLESGVDIPTEVVEARQLTRDAADAAVQQIEAAGDPELPDITWEIPATTRPQRWYPPAPEEATP